MEYCQGSTTLEVLQDINSFLKQHTRSTGILISAGSKMRPVNFLRSKGYLMILKNPPEGSLNYGTRRVPLVKSFELAYR